MSEYRCDRCNEITHTTDFHNSLVKINGIEKLICENCYQELVEAEAGI